VLSVQFHTVLFCAVLLCFVRGSGTATANANANATLPRLCRRYAFVAIRVTKFKSADGTVSEIETETATETEAH